MKKTLILLLIIISVTSLLLTSCTEDRTPDTTPDGGSENGGNEGGEAVDFTDEEKAMLTALGFEIPYLANNGYTLVDCSEEADGSSLCFCAKVGTQDEFDGYRALYSVYAYHGTRGDEDGITHHSYYADGCSIDRYDTAEDGGRVTVCVKTDKDGTGKNPTQNENGDCDVEFGDM